MATWKLKEVRAAIESKGFECVRSTGHRIYKLYHGGQELSVTTKLSHGSKKEIAEGSTLWLYFKNQLKLNNEQLRRFFNCPMTADELIEILVKAGIVSLN
jgi:predicted RNA binding protein YcfA (HicA-like mRNA interferase family)